MSKTLKRSWFGSAYFSVFLLAGIGLTGAKAHRDHVADDAPALPNYNWSNHAKVVALLVPGDDCGCGLKPPQIARKAAEHGVDFVQIAVQPSTQTGRATKSQTGKIYHVDPQTFASYCSGKDAMALEIRNGRIISRVAGNLPDDYFDRFAA